MADKTSGRQHWRQRIQAVGVSETIREEMNRLGFWSEEAEAEFADPERAERLTSALEKLRIRQEELLRLHEEIQEIDDKLREIEDVPRLITEIRRQRIARVQAEREMRRVEKERMRAERRERDAAWRKEVIPHVGREISAGLRYEGGDPQRLERLELPILSTAAELANAIGITTSDLAWLTYHRGVSSIDHYHRFTIPKRGGGTRNVSSPKTRMRQAQAWVLHEVLSKIEIHQAAMAFRPGRSIVDNARPHVGKAVVVRVDFKDFFPSITFRRVKGLFVSFGYNEGVATLLALLVTEAPRATVSFDGERSHVAVGERRLPQGACTSPALTNIICRRLDRRLNGLADHLGFTYGRYADDMIFSHNLTDAPVGALLNAIRKIVPDENFELNESKTVVMRRQGRQVVTGILVNNDLRVSRNDIRRFRAVLHQCEADGFEAVSERLGRDAQAYALGYLSYVQMINPDQAAQLQRNHPCLRSLSDSDRPGNGTGAHG